MENEFANQISSLNSSITIFRIVGWLCGLGAIFCGFMVWWQGSKIDTLRKPEKLVDLINKLEESPRDYDKILPRFLEIEISNIHYNRFKSVYFKYESLAQATSNPTALYNPNPEYKSISNEFWTFMVRFFPEDLFNDDSMNGVIRLNSVFHSLSSSQRKKCIDALFKSVQAKSLQRKLPVIERVLTDIVQYESALRDYFKKVFGDQNIIELKKLWPNDSFSIVMMPTEMRSVLISQGLLDH